PAGARLAPAGQGALTSTSVGSSRTASENDLGRSRGQVNHGPGRRRPRLQVNHGRVACERDSGSLVVRFTTQRSQEAVSAPMVRRAKFSVAPPDDVSRCSEGAAAMGIATIAALQ